MCMLVIQWPATRQAKNQFILIGCTSLSGGCAENAPMPSRARWTFLIIERQRFWDCWRSVQYFPAYIFPVSVPPRPPSLTGWEGLRKPPRLALSRNIAKSEKGDFCAISGRKSGNIGLLCHKVRMFCLESTDVCVKEVRCFRAWTRAFYEFFPLFLKFLRQSAVFSTDSSICWNWRNANTGWQKGENFGALVKTCVSVCYLLL